MSDTLYEYFNSGDTSADDFKASKWYAQSFTPTNGHVSTSAKIKIYRVGNGSTIGTITVSIKAVDGSGQPTGADLCSATMAATGVATTPTTGTWYEFTWGTPVLLNAATKYAIVCRTSGGNSSNFIQWRRNGNGYANGWSMYSNDSGANWNDLVTIDQMFEDYGVISIETYPATYVKPLSAVGNAYLEDPTNITQIGIEWGTTDGGPYPSSNVDTGGSYSAGLFGFPMTSLSANQTYYYRSKMYHSTYGWIYGNQETFTTPTNVPEARTDPPSDTTTTTIDAVGNILSTGADATCDARGFVYGLTSQSDPGNVAPGSSGYDSFVEDTGSFGTGSFTKQITGLTASKIYYVRAYCQNASAGYNYGDELIILTSNTVNILYPTSVSSGGIRFDSSPGGAYPNISSGTIAHDILVKSEDTVFTSGGRWGYLTGGFVYERNHTNDNFYTDLYVLSNPIRRTGTVVKVKWKAIVWRNEYAFGQYKRELYTNGSQYTGTAGDINNPGLGTQRLCEIFSTNPDTSAAWTIAELDALLAGISLGNEGGYGIAACDLVLIYVCWANAAVSMNGATVLNPTTLRLQGMVDEDEAEECSVYFEWGATVSYGNTTATQTKAKGETFTADITASPTIHARAVIETACGETFYSSDFLVTGEGLNQAIIIP